MAAADKKVITDNFDKDYPSDKDMKEGEDSEFVGSLFDIYEKVVKILEDDIESPPVDFFSPEEEEKVIEHVIEKFFSDHKESRGSLLVGAKFREKLKEGIEVDCVYVINTYKDLKTVSGVNGKSVCWKMGRFAFFREPLKNKKIDDIAKTFINLVEANLEFYNKTCVDGFQLTMDDVTEHLKRTNIKK